MTEHPFTRPIPEMSEGDVLQCFETVAYAIDGEMERGPNGEDLFEWRVLPWLDQLSVMQTGALAAWFLERGMDDYARFLAAYAHAKWSASPLFHDGPVVAYGRWRGRLADMEEAEAAEDLPF